MPSTIEDQALQARMDALAKKIIHQLQTSPDQKRSMFGSFQFAIWLGRHLNDADFILMYEMEEKLGEMVCNDWMVQTLIDSGKYKTVDGQTVELVEPMS